MLGALAEQAIFALANEMRHTARARHAHCNVGISTNGRIEVNVLLRVQDADGPPYSILYTESTPSPCACCKGCSEGIGERHQRKNPRSPNNLLHVDVKADVC